MIRQLQKVQVSINVLLIQRAFRICAQEEIWYIYGKRLTV